MSENTITSIKNHLTRQEFDPDVIIHSGQVFRMYKEEDMYYAFSGEHGIGFHEIGPEYWEFYTDGLEWHKFWRLYFDLFTSSDYYNYNKIIMNSQDDFLKNSLKSAQGMRILRQDLWETIVTFIISQQNNIPKITKTINILCEKFGAKSEISCGNHIKQFYTFPTPVQISDLSLKELSDGSLLGYRAKYILLLAQDVSAGKFSLDTLEKSSCKDSIQILQSVYGIGPKVANCISLYGLHHMDSYPIDVWVKRIIEQDYPQYSVPEYLEYINSNYPEFQGYVQQLQFYYKRKLENLKNFTKRT